MLLARVGFGPAAMSARQALEVATVGGARVLGRDDIGAIAPGMSADCVAFPLDSIGMAGGAVHDPLAALVFCTPPLVNWSVINGRVVVRDGVLTTVDLPQVRKQHNALARSLVV
ncbi:MAG: amidohydrolase family protein [Rhodocyclaceae bacterium]